MKIKSSIILKSALASIQAGTQQYACAAIQDAETTIRLEIGQEVSSSAMQIFSKFMPGKVRQDVKLYSQWWEKGSTERIEALEKAIAVAEKRQD